MVLTNLMNNNFKILQENSNTIKTAADTQGTNGEAVSKQLQELKQNVTALQSIVEDLHITNIQPIPIPTPTHSNATSYADIAARPSPFTDPHHANAIAKAKLANRCIIVKPVTDKVKSKMGKHSKKNLISSMNTALSIMATKLGEVLHIVPEDVKVIGVHKLTNSGMIYMFNSDDAATWLRGPGALENIQQAAGDGISVSLQLNSVIVPFAPTTIDIENTKTWHSIEDNSGLTAGTICNVRYLKPVEHHHEGQ
ncbi:hypothetical protein ARMGADRAFT_1090163 [Armillaria gallica]|uniref:Uncharacterized protein n=1 Tax=Armillaria gallica TaxID=47427 RepID=A0A2H3CVW3_ARMGA|nr:hypothetical protein ARMGADRAFT_1090163 [Armillaria gallica]